MQVFRSEYCVESEDPVGQCWGVLMEGEWGCMRIGTFDELLEFCKGLRYPSIKCQVSSETGQPSHHLEDLFLPSPRVPFVFDNSIRGSRTRRVKGTWMSVKSNMRNTLSPSV